MDLSKRFAGLSRERRDLVEHVLKTEGVDPWALPIRPRGAGARELPLAYTQESLWFMCQLAEDSGLMNLPSAVRLTGRLDRPALERAIRQIVERHEILRTRFPAVDGRPVQDISPMAEVFLTHHDCQALPVAERLAHALEHAARESLTPFDLAARPPFRMCLYALGPEDHVLLVVFHHLVWDGWSIGVWMRELGALYVAASRGAPSPLAPLPIQYADYALFERAWLSGDRVAPQIAYWRARLAGLAPAALPTDRPRPDRPTFAGAQELVCVLPETAAALDALCVREGVTPYMAMLAAFQAVLLRWTGQPKIAIGTPIAGRRRRELEPLVGTLANIVVMAADLSGDPTYAELVGRVREETRGAYANQDLPFEMIVEKLGAPRDPRMNPVFQVMFALHQEQLARLELPGLVVAPLDLGAQHSHFDLALHVWRHEGGFVGLASYNRDLFDAATVKRLVGHFQTLLAAAVRAPSERLSALPILTEEEARWLADRGAARVVLDRDPPSIEAPLVVTAEGGLEARGPAILDDLGRAQPIGVPGVLHATREDGVRIATRDRAVWRADGSIHVLGPARGWVWHAAGRLHVSEVEAALLSHPAIDAVHVASFAADGRDVVVAYAVASASIAGREVEAHARARLPTGLALRLVMVGALPIAGDGSIDARALEALPIVDDAAAAAWEARLAVSAGVGAVKVVTRAREAALPLVHVLDLLPDRRASRAVERHTTSALGAAPEARAGARIAYASGGALPIPEDAPATMGEALLRTAEVHGDHGLTLIEGAAPVLSSYRDLARRARRALAGLRAAGVGAGDHVILHVDDLALHLVSFWASVLAGAVPVAVATTGAYDRANGVVAKLHNVWALLGKPRVIASARLVEPLARVPSLFGDASRMRVIAAEELERDGPAEIHRAAPDDIAFLQLSSGSTGVPKCIQITHRGIVDFIHGARAMNGFGPDDVNVNWLPMDHVGPILTCHLKDTYLGCHQVHLRTELVLAEPLAWIDAIDAYRGNFSWSPNFGYKLVSDALAGGGARGRAWDLSCVKRLLNGGEQVTVPVAEGFLRGLAPYGLRRGVMQPSFGMAEACTCICYANDWTPETGVFRARKASLAGEIEACAEGEPDAIPFVDLGALRPGIEVRIVGVDGAVLPERVIGTMQIRGRSITPGYAHNDEANREALVGDGWLSSGDLGFLREGRLTITGRQKETLVVRGANFYCYEIEDAVSAVPGVEPTFAAACAVEDPATGSGGIAIFFAPRSGGAEGLDVALIRAVREKVSADFGVSPAVVIPVDKDRFPKTTSGKIQRSQLKRDLVEGRFDDAMRRADLAEGNEQTMPAWFHRPVWVRLDLPQRSARAGEGAWLVVGDGEGLAEAIARAVGEGEVVRVIEGEGFARVGARRFVIDPASAEDHDALLAAIAADGARVERAIHLGAYADAGPEPESVEAIDAAVARAARPLLLAQALARRGEAAHLVIAVQRREGGRVAYERAPLRAIAKGIPLEHASLSCQHVELPGEDRGADAARIVAEARAGTKEREVRWIEGARHVPRLATEAPIARAPLPFVAGDLVLVSGGLGGIGRALAKHLTAAHGLSVLLIGRTPIDRDAERRQALAELGASAAYEAADVADLDAVRAAVARAEARFGARLAGAFHLAGTLPTRLFAEETLESLAEVVRPKLAGAWVLGQVVGERGFVVGFGSGYGLFGGVGVGAYAAATSALEALFEEDRRLDRGPRFALSWSHWEELGMSRGFPLADRSSRLGYAMIGARRGLVAMEAALRSGHRALSIGLDARRPNVRRRVIEAAGVTEELAAYVERVGSDGSALDPPRREAIDASRATPPPFEIVEAARLPRDASGAIDVAALAGVCRAPGASSERILPRTGLERTIAAIWREVLNVDSVDVHTSFFALGGQSVMLVQVLTKLGAALDREISVIDLFKYPTVSALAAHLERAAPAARRSTDRAKERAQKQRDAARQQAGMRARAPRGAR